MNDAPPLKLSYTTLGRWRRPPILFLHGFLGRGDDWLEVATDLAEDYWCIFPDLPGHRGSAATVGDAPIDMESAVGAIVTLLEDFQVACAVIVGYSMGGRIALSIATEHPQLVEALVIESANPGIEGAREREARAALDDLRAEMIESKGLEAFVEQWYNAPLFASLRRQPERFAELRQAHRAHDPRSLAATLRGLSVGRQKSLWGELGEMQMPICIISGSLDDKYGEIASQMAARIANCRRAVIAAAGHNTHQEQPQEFIAKLREFLYDSEI